MEFNDPGLIFDIIIESAKNAENVSIFHSSFFHLWNTLQMILILYVNSFYEVILKKFKDNKKLMPIKIDIVS